MNNELKLYRIYIALKTENQSLLLINMFLTELDTMYTVLIPTNVVGRECMKSLPRYCSCCIVITKHCYTLESK